MLQWRILAEPEWWLLRKTRLIALRESPLCFLSSYEKEVAYDETQWREEFIRGDWITLGETDATMDGLIGVTHGDDISPNERYLEYLWISPKSRRSGIATNLMRTVLEMLRTTGIVTAWLWILDGNKPARELYEKLGFISTNERQPLAANPLRYEERMRLRLN
ncbi:MAG TPA: GNAT family N-acetyltransferase [Streptosporangiaceae bacterium]